ncbi:MAG TPA: anti-sigma factor [Thermoleophilaceae bacterium]|jgi:anti-sigma-K factor RskA
MTDCDRTELVAGYVLGALEPDEKEEMQRHLPTCAACAREHRSFAALPALLDQVEPDRVPPPLPPPELEEAVLDRVAKEAGRRPQVRRRVARARAGFWRPRRLLAGAAAMAAAAALALVLVLPGGGDTSAYARANLRGAQGAWAEAELASKDAGTQVHLEARGLAPAKRTVYELWCIRADGEWISGGTFHADRGRADVNLTAAVRAGDYHEMVVTVRAGEHKRGPSVLHGSLRY